MSFFERVFDQRFRDFLAGAITMGLMLIGFGCLFAGAVMGILPLILGAAGMLCWLLTQGT